LADARLIDLIAEGKAMRSVGIAVMSLVVVVASALSAAANIDAYKALHRVGIQHA
jgi:hypothetical protein